MLVEAVSHRTGGPSVAAIAKRLIQAHPAEIQRIEMTLEDAGIKLGSAASELISVSGRAMLDALTALS